MMTTTGLRTCGRAALVLAVLISLVASAGAAEPVGAKQRADSLLRSIKVPVGVDQKADNPLRELSVMMKRAGELLDTLDTGAPTQAEQRKILGELDRLIKMAQKSSSSSSSQQQQQQQQNKQKQSQPKNSQQQKPGNSKAGQGNTPAPDESDVLGSVKTRLGDGAPDLRAIWGKLPDAPRDDVQQLLSEKLPMKYKQLLYLYFKALSENK